MDLDRIEVEYNKIKNLRQYKNFSEEQLRKVAQNRAIESQIDLDEAFINKEDKAKAKNLLKKYLMDFTPESISDVNTLRSLLFLEIMNIRFQNELNNIEEKGYDIPVKTVETIHKNINEIQKLKTALGITKEKKDADAKSVAAKIATWKKQFKIWLDNNQASRTCRCPYCSQIFLLMIRTEHWDAKKHPFFKDQILYNEPLFKLYLEKRITKTELAKILEFSTDYIDWAIKTLHKTGQIKDDTEE